MNLTRDICSVPYVCSVTRERSAHGPPDYRSRRRSSSDLTDRQREVLDFISWIDHQVRLAATLREIRQPLRHPFHQRGERGHLRALEKKGYLQREDLNRAPCAPCCPPARPWTCRFLARLRPGSLCWLCGTTRTRVKGGSLFPRTEPRSLALRIKRRIDDEDRNSGCDYVFGAQQLQANVARRWCHDWRRATVNATNQKANSIRFQPANGRHGAIWCAAGFRS